MKRVTTILLVLWLGLLVGSPIVLAQEIIFTAQTTTGTEVVTPVLTWSTIPAADDCIATGDWVGAKGPAGSETLPDIVSSATYNLVCSWPAGAATLSWTAPTQNTDGTALTDLASYNVYQGSSPGDRSGPVYSLISPLVTSFVITPLSAGDYCWVATSINQLGVESVFSNEACKTVVALADTTQSVGITVNPRPNSPTNLGVT